MVYNIEFSKKARFDVIESYTYYRISPDLAERFMSNLNSAYKKIVSNPQYYGYCDFKKEYRDFKMKNFSFQISFKIQDEVVLIVRIHHASKKPNK